VERARYGLLEKLDYERRHRHRRRPREFVVLFSFVSASVEGFDELEAAVSAYAES
jgi:hypothetical protein